MAMDQLYTDALKELETVRSERDAALEREQALAAHVDRIEDELEASKSFSGCKVKAAISNARGKRDLIKQAEALEWAAGNIAPVFRYELKDEAKKLRQQAEAQDD